MTVVKEIILQLSFTLVPFIFFHLYYRNKMTNYSRSFILATSTICMLLAMTFAASVVDGIIFDIRYIVLFFALVFGGIKIGLIVLTELILYRIYLGGEGTLAGVLIVIYTFFLSIPIATLYRQSRGLTWVTVIVGTFFSIEPLILTYLFFPDYVMEHIFFHILVIPVQNCIGAWLLLTLFSKSVEEKNLFLDHAQNEKISAMSHVAASLAHEVRNPLTTVKGFLTLIKENPDDISNVERYISICLHEVERTESILSEYLSISKPITSRSEHMNVSEQLILIRDVMLPFANMNNVELAVHTPETPVFLTANPDAFKQILVNFIKNAIEACAETSRGQVTLTLAAAEKEIKLEIEDNGIGMTQEQIKRLGSIYFSTKSSGTGLGLTYCYRVIHLMGGHIEVNSKPNAGTRFTLTLPLQAESVAHV